MVTPTSVNERIPPRWCRVSGIPTYPAPYPSFGAQTYTYIPFTVCPDYTYDRKYPNPGGSRSVHSKGRDKELDSRVFSLDHRQGACVGLPLLC